MDSSIIYRLFFVFLIFISPVKAIEFQGKFLQGHFILGKTDPNSKTLPQQKTSQNSMNEGSNTLSGPCNRSGKSENVDLSDIGLALFLFLFSSRRGVYIRDI